MHALTHYVPTTQPCCSAGNPEGAVRHVIAQQGSQAPIQHQAGLMLLATCSLDWVHLSTMVTQPRLLVIDKVAANPSDMHRCSGHRGMCMPNVQFVLASRPSSCKLASALTCWRWLGANYQRTANRPLYCPTGHPKGCPPAQA